jgi:NAD(P)-dependent dehydrogenase (short-subunit alcohol dehydrogenase family)
VVVKRLFDLSGKLAIVTGGTRGIGAATAMLLAECGADIVVAGRDIARLESVTESARRQSGRKVMGVVADISREPDVVSLAHMLAQSRGAIVNISSLAGVNAVPFACAYGAAKAGLQNFTHATSTARACRGIRTNAIAVGVIAHESKVRSPEAVARIAAAIPMRRLGTPEEIASIVLFLVSDAASFVTGATILASGGMVDSAPTAS